MEAEASSLASSTDPQHVLSTSPRLPPNTRAIGIFVDSDHVGKVPRIIQHTNNEEACRLLSLWRREVCRFPFFVLAGQLGRHDGGIVGGLAADWQEALYLHAYARARLDYIAARGASFLSVWGLLLSDERRDAVLAIVAATQSVGGHA